VLLDTIIRDHLVLGHINRINLDTDTVPYWSANPFRERDDVAFNMLVFQGLGAPLSDNCADIQIDYLPDFLAGLPIVTWQQKTSVFQDDLDKIRVGNLLQGLVDKSLPTAGFTPFGSCSSFLR